MESEVSLEDISSEFLNTFGYGMDAFDFINFLIGESEEGIHRILFAESAGNHEFVYSKMLGMLSTKRTPDEEYKAFHNIFDPEIPIGEFAVLTIQSMPFQDAQVKDITAPAPYELRVYLISHHTIAMYGAEDAQEFMSGVLNDPHVVYKDAWVYEGLKKDSLRYLNFS